MKIHLKLSGKHPFCLSPNVLKALYYELSVWRKHLTTGFTPKGVSLRLVSFPNEFSWYHIFANWSTGNVLHPMTYLGYKLDDGSASVMQKRHLISNTKCRYYRVVTAGMPSTNLQPHQNSYGELTKCSETPCLTKEAWCHSKPFNHCCTFV